MGVFVNFGLWAGRPGGHRSKLKIQTGSNSPGWTLGLGLQGLRECWDAKGLSRPETPSY